MPDAAHEDFLARYLAEGRWETVWEAITACGIHQWIRDMDRPVRGIEIGVKEGMNAIAFLECCPNITEVVGIDPYEPYDDLGYHWSKEEQDTIHGYLLKNIALRQQDHRFTLLRARSQEAASLLPDDAFDFVYIDGVHTREAATADLEAYWPKLKRDGIMSGHDWDYVSQAVLQWRSANDIPGDITHMIHGTWAFRKSK